MKLGQGAILTVLLIALGIHGAVATRVQTGLYKRFPYCKCTPKARTGLILGPVTEYKDEDRAAICFSLWLGSPSDVSKSCNKGFVQLTKLEIDINPECTPHNTIVTPLLGSYLGTYDWNLSASFDMPQSAPQGRAILRINRINTYPNEDDPVDVCLHLEPNQGRPGACDSLQKLCAVQAGAPAGTCNVAYFGNQQGCCSSGLVQIGNPVYVLGPAFTPPWPCSYFVDTSASWIWSSAGANSVATKDTTPVFHQRLWLQDPVAAKMHIIADNACDFYLDGVYKGTALGGFQGSYTTQIPVQLDAGSREIVLWCTNAWVADGSSDSPAGVLAALVSDADGSVLIRTDAAWTYTISTTLDDVLPIGPTPAFVLGSPSMSPWFSSNFPDQFAFWIGATATDASDASCLVVTVYSKSLDLEADTQAVLHVAADNVVQVYLNGAFVAGAEGGFESFYPNHPFFALSLKAGRNTFDIRVTNAWTSNGMGPAGLLASLINPLLDPLSPNRTLLHTDSSWTVRLDQPVPPRR
ncbi:hypothetical protein HYH03_006521 [Edaphochlamys debaryana]|uniref:Pherophorin domain-containing protein n=1 Tax=Edaphochlamys debaryana TaxID=47281 RepID=A0A835Y5T6_9CHLO|nr:hypothetical protein HYH03_006521 [Edaphochlamys debaryana]|eukprot:KAG2495248.1 hypothetical protein HYH03_006521 [Edaphochlamys debaryana]